MAKMAAWGPKGHRGRVLGSCRTREIMPLARAAHAECVIAYTVRCEWFKRRTSPSILCSSSHSCRYRRFASLLHEIAQDAVLDPSCGCAKRPSDHGHPAHSLQRQFTAVSTKSKGQRRPSAATRAASPAHRC